MDIVDQANQLLGIPWYGLAFAVIAISWLWEDAAVILAALLALDGRMSLGLALFASFAGIVSGDMALYWLGRLGRRWRGLRAWIVMSGKSRFLRRRFHRRALSNIFIIRFIPGLRTLGFTLCGLWHVPTGRFAVAMVSAGVVWILSVFTVINLFGLSEAVRDSEWKWAMFGFALLLLLFNNLWAARMMRHTAKRR
ncbi:membrane protein DedA, SNARE-associated domain [Alteromonadaceae bacterium Bs31]|nr:membrane protein DedA, SNARE-associated domain [Alteromonadaceae bacterium Bs31]